MGIGELATPLRAYWDLLGGVDRPTARRVAGEMCEAGILSVSLWERAPAARAAVLEAASVFATAGRSVSLTVGAGAAGESLSGAVRDAGVRELLLHATTPAAALDAIPAVARLAAAAPAVGLSVAVSAATVRALPRLLAACARNGVARVELPVPRPADGGTGGHRGHLPPEGREAVARRLRGIDFSRTTVVAHDPFLSEILFPDANHGDDGCQAANSLVFVSEDLAVLACPILPAELGDLRAASFGDIVRGPVPRALRSAIRAVPRECWGCSKVGWCQGGCRGRALVAAGSLDVPDPVCGPTTRA